MEENCHGGEVSNDIQTTTEILRGAHLDAESTRKFSNALEYHRAAIETKKLENQLLDLWAALEGFLPQPKGEARIVHYLSALLPSITLTYAEKLFRYASDELRRDELGGEVRQLVEGTSTSGDFFEKTVQLIVAEELTSNLELLMPLLEKSPLLRHRIFKLHEGFRTSGAILSTLRAHRTKVAWHIQRIYGTRNMIIHSAESFRYLRTLVENLHAYLDTLIPAVSRLAVESPSQLDIHAAIQLLTNYEEVTLATLNHDRNIRCTVVNFKPFVFGESNPLSPFS